MSRKTYRYVDGKMVLVRERNTPKALHYIQTDLPGYESPTTGKWVEGRRARREDLKRSNCRPWEGLEQEKREAARERERWDRQADQVAERIAGEMWRDMPESKRKLFRYK